MNQSWEWDEDDLLALITNQTKESIELDYKECGDLGKSDGKKRRYHKDVSAFANSAGGTIVYGMKENGHVPVELDSGYDPTDISKEWLEQVIISNIQRRLNGVRINPVELKTSSPGKVAYVVYIPQSTRAPHQASDWRFYKRFNFQSVPMEEYEIRDVAGRDTTPDLSVLLRISKVESPSPVPEELEVVKRRFGITPHIHNDAATPAEYAVIELCIDERLKIVSDIGHFKRTGSFEIEAEGSRISCQVLSRVWSVYRSLVIFKGIDFAVVYEPIVVELPDAGRFLIGTQVQSPKMKPWQKINWLAYDGTLSVASPENADVVR